MVAIFISQQGECYLRYQGLPIVIIWHGGMGYGNYCHRVRFGQTQGPRFGENPKGHTLMVKMLRKIVYIIIRKACMLYQALTVYLNIVGRGGGTFDQPSQKRRAPIFGWHQTHYNAPSNDF